MSGTTKYITKNGARIDDYADDDDDVTKCGDKVHNIKIYVYQREVDIYLCNAWI